MGRLYKKRLIYPYFTALCIDKESIFVACLFVVFDERGGGIELPFRKEVSMWQRFDAGRSMQGCLVEGDTTVPPTTWWNRLWLALFVWDTVAVLEAATDKAFRVGFRNKRGDAYITTKLINTSAKLGQIAESEMVGEGANIPSAGPRPRPRGVTARRWPHVCMLVRFEDCWVFAIDENGTEVPVRLIKRESRRYYWVSSEYNTRLYLY